jgi:hypothetical protein
MTRFLRSGRPGVILIGVGLSLFGLWWTTALGGAFLTVAFIPWRTETHSITRGVSEP